MWELLAFLGFQEMHEQRDQMDRIERKIDILDEKLNLMNAVNLRRAINDGVVEMNITLTEEGDVITMYGWGEKR